MGAILDALTGIYSVSLNGACIGDGGPVCVLVQPIQTSEVSAARGYRDDSLVMAKG